MTLYTALSFCWNIHWKHQNFQVGPPAFSSPTGLFWKKKHGHHRRILNPFLNFVKIRDKKSMPSCCHSKENRWWPKSMDTWSLASGGPHPNSRWTAPKMVGDMVTKTGSAWVSWNSSKSSLNILKTNEFWRVCSCNKKTLNQHLACITNFNSPSSTARPTCHLFTGERNELRNNPLKTHGDLRIPPIQKSTKKHDSNFLFLSIKLFSAVKNTYQNHKNSQDFVPGVTPSHSTCCHQFQWPRGGPWFKHPPWARASQLLSANFTALASKFSRI